MMAYQKNIFSSSRGALLIFAFFSVGLCFDSCDIGDCSAVFQGAFSKLISNDVQSLCWDIESVSKCLNECKQVFFPHYPDMNTIVSFLNEICNKEFVYDVADHWECIRKHLNKLFMCIARSSSIRSSTSGSSAGKLIACRRRLLIFDCPYDVFSGHCEDDAVQIVSKKFQDALKPWLNSSCYGIPQNKVYNLDVNYGLKSDLDTTANCIDNYSYLAEDCFSEYLEKAVRSEIDCWKDTMVVCNKPSASIPCSPPSSVANFYSSLFSYGKLDCMEPSSISITKSNSKPNNLPSPNDFDEPNTSTESMQPPSFSLDPTTTTSTTTTTTDFPETKPPFPLTDFKPNDENILSPNHMPNAYFSPTDETHKNFSQFGSSISVTSSEDVSSVKKRLGSQVDMDKSVSSHSQCTYISTLLFLPYIFIVIFFPK